MVCGRTLFRDVALVRLPVADLWSAEPITSDTGHRGEPAVVGYLVGRRGGRFQILNDRERERYLNEGEILTSSG